MVVKGGLSGAEFLARSITGTTWDGATWPVGDFFFPLHETPTKDEFPERIESRRSGLRFEDIVRLAQIVERPGAQRGARHLDVLVAGQDDDAEGRTVAAHVIEHLDPGHLRHHQVEQDDIGLKDRY